MALPPEFEYQWKKLQKVEFMNRRHALETLPGFQPAEERKAVRGFFHTMLSGDPLNWLTHNLLPVHMTCTNRRCRTRRSTGQVECCGAG